MPYTEPGPEPVLVADVNTLSVIEAERLMVVATKLRHVGILSDMLFLLAHPETVSLGLKDRLDDPIEDLLVPRSRLQAEGIALTRSIRGGGITYHWPGQVVCYPVLALHRSERNVPQFMHKLEQVAIDTLRDFGIEAGRRRDTAAHIGLWHDSRKIVSMGIRISGWITSFGFAINYCGDYSRAALRQTVRNRRSAPYYNGGPPSSSTCTARRTGSSEGAFCNGVWSGYPRDATRPVRPPQDLRSLRILRRDCSWRFEPARARDRPQIRLERESG